MLLKSITLFYIGWQGIIHFTFYVKYIEKEREREEEAFLGRKRHRHRPEIQDSHRAPRG